jgi:ketosteroid isomerase-like protein
MADQDAGGMTELDRRKRDLEVLQALYARWSRGDFSFIEPFAEDLVWAPADALESGEYKGIEEMNKSFKTFLEAWEEFQIKATEVIPFAGGKYVVMQVFRGKGKSSGAETEGTSGLVITMRDGGIARMEGYWDRDAALKAADADAGAG